MSQTITAIYEDGVLKPAEPLDLAPHTAVQLTIEELPGTLEASQSKEEVLAMMKQLWAQTKAHNAPHLTRDQLHERR